MSALKALNDVDYFTKLDIIGSVESDDFFKKIKSIIAYYDMENNISFKGFVNFGEDLFNYYRQSDYFILPSYSEGFPHVIWEAAANLCPIITTNVGGIGDLIKHKEHGMLIKPKEPGDIVQSVIELEKNIN